MSELRSPIRYKTCTFILMGVLCFLSACTKMQPVVVENPQENTIRVVAFDDKNGNGIYEGNVEGLYTSQISLYGTGTTPLQTQSFIPKQKFLDFTVDPSAGPYRVGIEKLVNAPSNKNTNLATSSKVPIQIMHTVETNEVTFIPVPRLHKCDSDNLDLERNITSEDPSCTNPLLPDLLPTTTVDDIRFQEEYPGTDKWYIDTTSQTGHTLLRFGTSTANLGNGPLHIVGGSTVNESQQIFQRIYTENGSYLDRAAGEFLYHPTHEHIHMNHFMTYSISPKNTSNTSNIPNSTNAITSTDFARGTKISFCITDVLPRETQKNPDLQTPIENSSPYSNEKNWFRVDLPSWQCGRLAQGLNVGWSDYYGPKLPDQWIDVTGMKPGEYTLTIEVDPDNLIWESIETNNVISIPVVLP